ncbi:ATP-binding protein [Cupriavidus sp. L7L]|uniref:AAA family ATPase n=1 Tax=Cupriavidus sp. L7L TaxID=2546443 RepID=UPI001405459E|nr:ATP-binding protein [Cupriavidus sp. L7L]
MAEPFYLVSCQSDGLLVPLHSHEDKKSGPKVTVVIGPNGSGKSTAIAAVVEELAFMHSLLYPDQRAKHLRLAKTGTITYRHSNNLYRVVRMGTKIEAFINGKEADPTKVPFPSRALAVAHLPTDKFRYSDNEKKDFYRYLGLRQATNLVTTGALEAKVVADILAGQQSETYPLALNEWLAILQISDEFEIELRGLPFEVFHIQDVDDLDRRIRRSSSKNAAEHLKFHADEGSAPLTQRDIAGFFRRLGRLCEGADRDNFPPLKSKASYILPLSALRDDPLITRITWEAGIDLMRKMRLADEIRLMVRKNGRRTPFADLSSGERQILGTFTRLFRHAENGSVVVIDEPEISLHPSWQIRYIPTLLKALRHLPSAHVVIATHSHFLVSDVGDAASLVVAETDQTGRWHFTNFEGDVFGRTPENILYRAFGIGSVTNFYVEHDLTQALMMLANPAKLDREKLHAIKHRLDKVKAPDNPAFDQILNTINNALIG